MAAKHCMATTVNRPPGFCRCHLIEKNIAENDSVYVLTEIDSDRDQFNVFDVLIPSALLRVFVQ